MPAAFRSGGLLLEFFGQGRTGIGGGGGAATAPAAYIAAAVCGGLSTKPWVQSDFAYPFASGKGFDLTASRGDCSVKGTTDIPCGTTSPGDAKAH